MRVAPNNQIAVAGRAKSGKTRSNGAFTVSSLSSEAINTNQEVASPVSLEALVALQSGKGSRDEASQEGVDWSNNVLDRLETLQRDILLGRISLTGLQEIENTISRTLKNHDDPALNAIQAQILLRARVELAKLEHQPSTEE